MNDIENDVEFVERMIREWAAELVQRVEDYDRLFALARRGAAQNLGQDAKSSEGISQWRPISEEDREWIDRRAYDLYQGWQRRMGSVRTQVIRPEDSICHWIMDATLERMIPLPPPPSENADD